MKTTTYCLGYDHFVVVEEQPCNTFLAAFYYRQNPNCLGTKEVRYHRDAIDELAKIIDSEEGGK